MDRSHVCNSCYTAVVAPLKKEIVQVCSAHFKDAEKSLVKCSVSFEVAVIVHRNCEAMVSSVGGLEHVLLPFTPTFPGKFSAMVLPS